jgi:hypothetical protein
VFNLGGSASSQIQPSYVPKVGMEQLSSTPQRLLLDWVSAFTMSQCPLCLEAKALPDG